MRAKFQEGDSVRFSSRAFRSKIEGLSRRTRKVVTCQYMPGLKATLYELGRNGGNHKSGMWFRSYELNPVKKRRMKRQDGQDNLQSEDKVKNYG